MQNFLSVIAVVFAFSAPSGV